MTTSRHIKERIAIALKQAETGTPVAGVIRRMGVSKQTFYRWKEVSSRLGVGELRGLQQREEDNHKLQATGCGQPFAASPIHLDSSALRTNRERALSHPWIIASRMPAATSRFITSPASTANRSARRGGCRPPRAALVSSRKNGRRRPRLRRSAMPRSRISIFRRSAVANAKWAGRTQSEPSASLL